MTRKRNQTQARGTNLLCRRLQILSLSVSREAWRGRGARSKGSTEEEGASGPKAQRSRQETARERSSNH